MDQTTNAQDLPGIRNPAVYDRAEMSAMMRRIFEAFVWADGADTETDKGAIRVAAAFQKACAENGFDLHR